MKYDVIVIGSGIAGLWCAIHLNKPKVLVITKSNVWSCNSFYAQGGVTIARDKDDIPSHISDTLLAGAYHNNKKNVELLSTKSLEVIRDIEDMGFRFDRDQNGILFTKEGAHSNNRIVHANGDATGRELHRFILSKNYDFLTRAMVVDLLIDGDVCYGVTALKDNQLHNIYANHVVIASGGIGGIYKYDTNANVISGDLQGLAALKGIELSDMEMTQFHPTVYTKAKTSQKLLLSEALRGEGAKVVDENRSQFLYQYDKRGELASRDIVSRAIYDYQQKGHEVFLDFSSWDSEFFKNRFPTIFYKFRNLGYNIPQELVPISPAFHYIMGGITTDKVRVNNFQNLYAIGEVANTGVHGANRLASNSLLECFVFGKLCAMEINNTQTSYTKQFPISINTPLHLPNDKTYKNQLREVMWDNVGIVRNTKGLQKALAFVDDTKDKVGLLSKFRFITAMEIIKQALNRKQSLGAHYIVN
ncbi:MAG: L-aspartate oxidase [Epsilonproteobacteria bacterium]|nr:L-aspartate oxidase [Campylobacterota bacterium]